MRQRFLLSSVGQVGHGARECVSAVGAFSSCSLLKRLKCHVALELGAVGQVPRDGGLGEIVDSWQPVEQFAWQVPPGMIKDCVRNHIPRPREPSFGEQHGHPDGCQPGVQPVGGQSGGGIARHHSTSTALEAAWSAWRSSPSSRASPQYP